MNTPIKPFPTYKWRWLSVQPTEGLLIAPVFLGVLRALRKNQGSGYSAEALKKDLQTVQERTETNVTLARSPERNLFRNSGQYWRGTGLVEASKGVIELTPLGVMVADGRLTKDEFVALVIRNTILPNPLTFSVTEMNNWDNAGVRIKPFELILSIMIGLGRMNDLNQAYLTPNELIKIVIPLVGSKEQTDVIINAIASYRIGELNIERFPDCAPGSNDKRMAREFLLFLRNFGVCLSNETDGQNPSEEQFRINDLSLNLITNHEEFSVFEDESLRDEELSALRESEIPIIIERQRRLVSVVTRSGQGVFRREVMRASNNRCIFTQETTRDVIEAAHIIPVANGGADSVGNGLCMRVDIHKLFDNGKIRLSPTGAVSLNRAISDSASYRNLPQSITFPQSVDLRNIEWRFQYL